MRSSPAESRAPLPSSSPQVPFLDLRRENQEYREDFHHALDVVLQQDRLILGDVVARFEEIFASAVGCSFAVGTASGADALELIFRSLDCPPDAEVIVPANSFFASASSVTMAGLKPIFADVEADGLISLRTIEQVASRKTKIVLPVHLYGKCVEMEPIVQWAKRNEIFVVEDAAQSLGARYHGGATGNLADAAAFSLYPAKNLGALGDGGVVTTDNELLAKKIHLLRNYGSSKKYSHEVIGRNSRLDSLQAAFLLKKLTSFESRMESRRALAKKYFQGLKGLRIRPFRAQNGTSDALHLFVVLTRGVEDRLLFKNFLEKRNIETMIHYPVPIHRQPAYRDMHHRMPLSISEQLCSSVLSLPFFPTMTDEEVYRVVLAVQEFCRIEGP